MYTNIFFVDFVLGDLKLTLRTLWKR